MPLVSERLLPPELLVEIGLPYGISSFPVYLVQELCRKLQLFNDDMACVF